MQVSITADTTVLTPLNVAPLPSEPFTFPMGYRNVTTDYLLSDPPRPEELSALLSVIELHFDDVARVMGADPSPDDGRSVLDMTFRDGRTVGIGRLVEVAAAVEIGIDPFNATEVRGFLLGAAAAEDVFRTLATESLADRLHNPGLPAEWGTTVVGGCCLIVGLLRRFQIDGIVVGQLLETAEG